MLDLSNITGALNIPDEVAKSTTRKKIILLATRNISQTVSDKGTDAIRGTYPSGKQYLVPI